MMKRDGEECKAYHNWYDKAYVFFKSVGSLQNDPDLQLFVNAEKEGNCFVLAHIYDTISPSYKVLMQKTKDINKDGKGSKDKVVKPYKIFISHCGTDKAVTSALVDLLGEIINLSDKNLFCSSVHGFDVMVGKNFMDNIMEQYSNHNLFLLYVLSRDYMNSPICLNEMGASWMTKMDSIGILLPGFDIKDLGNSCYDKQSISIIFNQGDSEVKHRLNQLKETVEALFPQEIKMINPSRWEEKRDGFISVVKDISGTISSDDSKGIIGFNELGINQKASIVPSVNYKGNGSYVVTFSNQGSSPAENLLVEFDDVDGIYFSIDRGLFPIEFLKPGRSFQVNATMTDGATQKLMSLIKWQEKDKQFEEKELIIFNK